MAKVSVVLPVYNEENYILEILSRVNNAKLPKGFTKEIIVVNDGSTDKTVAILKKNKKLYTKLVDKENGGQGSALKAGYKVATGDYVINQDADLEYHPKDYVSLLTPLLKNECDVVYGSRFMRAGTQERTWAVVRNWFGNHVLSIMLSVLFMQRITDIETGYKCLPKNIYKNYFLAEDDFKIHPELTAKLIKNKVKIKEVPISYEARTFEEGKKIYFKDGVLAVVAILRYRFLPSSAKK